MSEHKVDIEIFKENYSEIILKFNPILYDDEYMVVLAGKTHYVKLDNKNKDNVPEITYQMADRKVLNSFETTMVNNFNEYNTLLILNKRILIDFTTESRKYELYDYKNIPLYDVYYLKRKYFKNKNFSIIVNEYDEHEKANEKLLANMGINIELYNSKICEKSFICFFRSPNGIYNYIDYIKFFINTYNDLIKITPNNNTYCIFIKTDYYIELIMDMIDIFRYYYDKVVLVRTKYNSKYNFMLILENKIREYNPKHTIEFKKKLYRIQNNQIDTVYVDFMNKLYKDYANRVKIIMSINKLDNDNKILIGQRFKFYQEYYHINFVKKYNKKS